MATVLSKTTEEITKSSAIHNVKTSPIKYKTVKVEGLDIFYRETGTPDKPSLLLLHGFPSSSHMFRDLLTALGTRYHLIAPDYPGFGNSSMPTVNQFEYSFDHLARIMDEFISSIHLNKFSLYMMDYGAPIGFRLATKHPDKIQALIIQNGNAYNEGLSPFWNKMKEYWKEPKKESNIHFIKEILTPDSIKSQYTDGVRDISNISPDNWIADLQRLNQKGNESIQMELLHSYKTNIPLYDDWQAYMRKQQPPTLVVWGKNDNIFTVAGANAFKKDLKNVEVHLLNTGHFALEEDCDLIATLIDEFLVKNHIK